MTAPGLGIDLPQVPEVPLPRECPYRPTAGYDRLRGRTALTRARMFDGRLVWLVTGRAEAQSLLADSRISCDRQNPNLPMSSPQLRAFARTPAGQVLIGVDPPEHSRQRKMLISAFTVKRIAMMRAEVEKVATEQLNAMLAKGQPADLVADYAMPVSCQLMCTLLGVPYADREFFEEQARRRFVPDQVVDAMGRLNGYLDELVRTKEREPGVGLIDDLVREQLRPGKLDRQDLISFATVMLMAGQGTTSEMIGLGILALLEHPEQLAALREDPSLLPVAVDELLRYVSLVEWLDRVATEDIEIAGQTIRAGDGILVAAASANHDAADLGRESAELDVRSPVARGHLAFGYGIHQCLGQNLVRTELEIAYRVLIQGVPTLRTAVPLEEIDVGNAGALQRLPTLPVVW